MLRHGLKKLHQHRYLIGSGLAFTAWQASLLFGHGRFGLLNFILGLTFCGFVPGLLIVMSLGARRLSLQTALFAAGLSVVFDLIVGLTANYVPLLFGVHRPLSFATIDSAYCGWLLLGLAAAIRTQKRVPHLLLPKLHFEWRSAIVYTLALLGLIACVLGTFRLNNGADNILSICGFGTLIANILLVFIWRKRLPTHAYLAAIIGLSWGLLLLTSLRSNFISGQDLKQEVRVYNITNAAGMWKMSNFNDSYNACLSITLYPMVLVKLLGVSSAVVFKLVFQLLFVICPLAVFTLVRSIFGRSLALLSTIFFFALPTLGLDLPLQTRQQMAFLLFSLVMLSWFHHTEPWIRRHWHLLFTIFAFAVIVSHYSTAYIFVTTLVLNYVLRFILLRTRFAKKRHLATGFHLSGRLVVVTALFAFFWLGQVTSASSNLVDKIHPAVSSLLSGNPLKSTQVGDTDSRLVNGKGKDPLYGYVVSTSASPNAPTKEVFVELKPIDDSLQPAKPLRSLPTSAQNAIKQISKKMYYLLGMGVFSSVIVLGLVSMIARRRDELPMTVKPEYVVLSLAVLLVLGLQAVLPGITQDYGITRSFIQAFIILCVPFMFGLREIVRHLPRTLATRAVAALAIIMLMTSTGLTAQLLGGTRPQLNFNNAGPYYGAFYVRRSDVLAYGWIEQNIKYPGNVNAPDYSFPTSLAYYPQYRHYGGGIFPFQVVNGHYTLLNYPQTHDGTTYTTGSVLAVRVSSTAYSDDDIIYTNSNSVLYR